MRVLETVNIILLVIQHQFCDLIRAVLIKDAQDLGRRFLILKELGGVKAKIAKTFFLF